MCINETNSKKYSNYKNQLSKNAFVANQLWKTCNFCPVFGKINCICATSLIKKQHSWKSQLIFFKCFIFPPINTTFLQKSAIFATSCWNMNFSQSFFFFKWGFFLCKYIIILLKISKIHDFMALNVEIWTFLKDDIF